MQIQNKRTYKLPLTEKLKNQQFGFPTRSNTNQAVQPQKKARSVKLDIRRRGIVLSAWRKQRLFSCAVIAQLICVFVFAYANCWFSHAKAQFCLFELMLNVPVKSFGHVGTLPSFYGTFIPKMRIY